MSRFRLDRFFTLYAFWPLLRGKGGFAEQVIPILMYHSISDGCGVSRHPYYDIHTTSVAFERQMRFLSDGGYSVIDLHRLEIYFEGIHKFAKKLAVITFDDGYRDFYSAAFPVLQEHRFPATVFLPAGFIDQRRKTFKGKECLNWKEVGELHEKGVSFGSHSLNHPELYRLHWDTIRRELADSRIRIEEQLQAPVNSFCYPYAFPQEDSVFVQRFRRELADQGYRYGVTTAIGRARRTNHLLSLKRLPVNHGDDERLFAAKLSGGYDWMAHAQAFVRRIKYRLNGARSDSG